MKLHLKAKIRNVQLHPPSLNYKQIFKIQKYCSSRDHSVCQKSVSLLTRTHTISLTVLKIEESQKTHASSSVRKHDGQPL